MLVELNLKSKLKSLVLVQLEFARSTDGFIDGAIVTKGQPTIIGLGPHPDAAR